MAAPSQGILSLNIKDKSALYAAYMPYVKNGGLFIPTNKQYSLGDEVFMLLSLMEDKERLPVAGNHPCLQARLCGLMRVFYPVTYPSFGWF